MFEKALIMSYYYIKIGIGNSNRRYIMQLTDAEIKEILARQKLRKRMQQKRKRRRMIFFILLIIIVALIVILKPAVRISERLEERNRKAAREASYTGPPRGTIFIDPGHGGMDSGSVGEEKRYEKDDTLRLSTEIRSYLESYGFTVVMSRTEDKEIDRDVRGKMANDAGAKLFISIHRNKAESDGQGVEAYIPKRNDEGSRLLADNLLNALEKEGFVKRKVTAGTLNDPDSDYEENAAATMPAVLLEVGFISSDTDNALFDDNLGRNARAISKAIDKTFMTLYEPEKAAEAAEEEARMKKLTDEILYTTLEGMSGLVPTHSKETEFQK